MNNILISICIPTYGRVEILKKTLESIFSQNCDTSLYEICISDNSPTDETEIMINNFFSDRNNLIYGKSTREGYYNSIEALKLGKGKFLKLHNNYSQFRKNTFQRFIELVNTYTSIDSVLFFTSGTIKQCKQYQEYETFNSFMDNITYYSTWSTSFGLWKRDFNLILEKEIELDKMFPHTNLLFSLTDKNKYIIDNYHYFENQDVGKKGGYNLPETFGNRYLLMCKRLLDKDFISKRTFDHIKNNILKFIAEWYLNITFFDDKYTFDFENWEKIIFDLYGEAGIFFVKSYVRQRKLKFILKKILHRY